MTKWHRLDQKLFHARRFGLILLSLLLSSAMTSKAYGHKVYIFDVSGKAVFTRQGTGFSTYSVSDLNLSGIHFVKVTTPNGSRSKRVMFY